MPVWLFAPANAARKAQGALASSAEQVVLDLEDAVPDGEKPAARAALQGLALLPRRGRLFVRVNAMGTPHCLRDIEAAVAAGADGIMLPKAEGADEVAAVAWALAQFEAERAAGPLDLVPLVETAKGLMVLALGGASSGAFGGTPGGARWPGRVRRLAFGSVDYEMDLGLSGNAGAAAVESARHGLVLASRAAGLSPPIDGVTLAARDGDACLRDGLHASGLGFGGKLAIHPAQIEPIQSAFQPSAADVDWATEVVTRFAEATHDGSGAILVRGRLVDAPVVAQARRVLARRRDPAEA